MEQKFCPTCGKLLNEQAVFCETCGTRVAVQPPVYAQPQPVVYAAPQPVAYVKPKVRGRGLGISSMVLGIIGLIFSFSLSLTAITEIVEYQNRRYVYNYYYHISNHNPAEDYIPSLIIFVVLPLLATIFGFASKKRGYRCGVSTSGVTMGIIGLVAMVGALLFTIMSIM